MVVLPPGLEIHETLGSSPSSPVGDDVEWQVGPCTPYYLYHNQMINTSNRGSSKGAQCGARFGRIFCLNEKANFDSKLWAVCVCCQVGLHEALAQDTRVILVQLGEVGPQGYTHLSPTLQNFIHKRSPLCWLEDSPGAADWNSRFWKRVRYEMPVVSAKPSSLSVL